MLTVVIGLCDPGYRSHSESFAPTVKLLFCLRVSFPEQCKPYGKGYRTSYGGMQASADCYATNHLSCVIDSDKFMSSTRWIHTIRITEITLRSPTPDRNRAIVRESMVCSYRNMPCHDNFPRGTGRLVLDHVHLSTCWESLGLDW